MFIRLLKVVVFPILFIILFIVCCMVLYYIASLFHSMVPLSGPLGQYILTDQTGLLMSMFGAGLIVVVALGLLLILAVLQYIIRG